MAGVSVRTLHLYDQIGLLKPAIRTEARYRYYGEPELLRLQQILFYRELDFQLQEIAEILDDPGFDVLRALEEHKRVLKQRGKRIAVLVQTIDKTITNLKQGTMLTHEELYEGLPKEKSAAWNKEAREKYGDEAVYRSENALKKMSKQDFEQLKTQSAELWEQLRGMKTEDPVSVTVQNNIAKHYTIIRRFWGTENMADKQADAYKGLGQLYVDDERFTAVNDVPDPAFAIFMRDAMAYYAETLKH